ncbi:hypothetical protein VPH35_089979 [Triticum aestivum]
MPPIPTDDLDALLPTSAATILFPSPHLPSLSSLGHHTGRTAARHHRLVVRDAHGGLRARSDGSALGRGASCSAATWCPHVPLGEELSSRPPLHQVLPLPQGQGGTTQPRAGHCDGSAPRAALAEEPWCSTATSFPLPLYGPPGEEPS